MGQNQKSICFVSYSKSNSFTERVLKEAIYPILKNGGWDVIDPRTIELTIRPYELSLSELNKANLFIYDPSDLGPKVLFEIGLARAWGIPIYCLGDEIERIPFDSDGNIASYRYTKDENGFLIAKELFSKYFERLKRRKRELFSRDVMNDYGLQRSKSISIEFISEYLSAIDISQFTYLVLKALNSIEALEENSFRVIRVGSFGAWVSSNLESITNLAEKIIFFIPEWKKRNAETLKIEAEAQVLLAQAHKLIAESNEIQQKTNRKNIKELFSLMQRGRNMGPARLIIGDRIRIESDEKGVVYIGLPPVQTGE